MASYQLLQIPVGYRFQPTDEELIAYYLTKKVKGERLPWEIIGGAEIYGDNEPWKTFGETSSETFYVFTNLKKKGNGKKRIDRIAGSGTWKDQRKDPVKDSKGNVIGFRRLLSFEVKGSDGSKHRGKGHWIMHEYTLLDDNQSCVLCTLKNKVVSKRMIEEVVIAADNADQPTPSKRMIEEFVIAADNADQPTPRKRTIEEVVIAADNADQPTPSKRMKTDQLVEEAVIADNAEQMKADHLVKEAVIADNADQMKADQLVEEAVIADNADQMKADHLVEEAVIAGNADQMKADHLVEEDRSAVAVVSEFEDIDADLEHIYWMEILSEL